ncbi:MAG: putative lipopolysaccharide heptosyltransferase III [Gammaproteobacteria bacterium]
MTEKLSTFSITTQAKTGALNNVIKINMLDDAVDFTRIKRILVIKLQHLGDVLLTTPLFGVLKQQYPQIEIDVLIYQETAPVLEANPHIRHIHAVDRSWKKKGIRFQLQREYRLLRELQRNRYDLIINLTDRWRGGWLTRVLRPDYSVSRPYAHRRGKLWRKSFSHISRVPQYNRHAVEANLDAVRRLGVQPLKDQKKLTLMVDAESEAKVRQLLQPHQSGDKKMIVIHPTSRWMFKAWNPEGFARVIDNLNALEFCVVLISGPASEEIDYVSAILEATASRVINFAGRLSLNESAALIKLADCFLGLDSVATHIAAAVNTPCVVLFGPTTDKVWHPWMVAHKVITTDFACRPCGLKGCGDGMVSECIQVIQPEKVVQAIESLTQGKALEQETECSA